MRKFVISLAAAGAALAIASPASAQYYQGQPQPGYGAPYGNAYGYQNNWGMVRELQQRLNNVERQINRLDRRDRRDRIRDRSADRLRADAADLHRRLYDRSRNGLDRREAGDIIYRLQRLEQRVQFAMNQGGYGRYNGEWRDRDRDGRNDRWEDDHGYRRDR